MKARLNQLVLAAMLVGASVGANAQKNNANLLFFQHGADGTLQAAKQTNCYQLRITGIDKDVIYLSNSPDEITGHLSIPVFITSWQHQQATSGVKPNAILHASLIDKNNKERQVSDVFVLKGIAYQSHQHAMIYQICRFNDEQAFKLGRLRNINIFIDPFHRWPP